MEKPECSTSNANPRRKFLYMAISSILLETGFENADKICLETLSEMIQSCMFYMFIIFSNCL